MQLNETVDLMQSANYKERFIAEYLQTKIRYEKLKKYNTKIEASERFATPVSLAGAVFNQPVPNVPKVPHDCPAILLKEQQRAMGEYLHILEVRAEIEGIDLEKYFTKEK